MGDSSSVLIAIANRPPVRKYAIMPYRYWMPTILWLSVNLKYLAKPGSAPSSSWCTSRSGFPDIVRARSLNTPSPASQPITASA